MKPLLSPKELADAIGVSESSIKRWVDNGEIQATKTSGGHRRIPVNEAVRFVRETQSALVNPEAIGLKDVASLFNLETPRDSEGAPSGDPYILPTLCAATVLESQGFNAVNLGADTPLHSLLLASEATRSQLVWLSVSVRNATEPPSVITPPP